jgi:hypothetical protein
MRPSGLIARPDFTHSAGQVSTASGVTAGASVTAKRRLLSEDAMRRKHSKFENSNFGKLNYKET